MSKFLLALIFCSSMVLASGDAMFGLRWGMSPDSVRAAGVTLEKVRANNNLFGYKTTSLPKNLSITEFYSLIFDGDTSLVKIIVYAKTITDDPYGTEGKGQFDRLLKSLKQSYKVTNTYCYTGQSVYNDNDEFYECLAYEGCGSWATFLSSDNKSIDIEMKGVKRGTGYIVMYIEAVPEFKIASENFNKINVDSDADALK